MPYLNLITNVNVSKEKEREMVNVLGKGIEVINGKSEQGFFIKIEGGCALYKGGNQTEPNAMITVDLFGHSTGEDLSKYCDIINELLEKELGIQKEKIFINFTECRHWGANGNCNTAFNI